MSQFYVNPNRKREVWFKGNPNELRNYIVIYWSVTTETGLVWPLEIERQEDPIFMSKIEILNRGYKKYEKK